MYEIFPDQKLPQNINYKKLKAILIIRQFIPLDLNFPFTFIDFRDHFFGLPYFGSHIVIHIL